MRKIKVKELSLEAFKLYGSFEKMEGPEAYHFGAPPIKFYRDMIGLDLGGAAKASFSICQVEQRPFVIDKTEYHSSTGEGILPLDADVVIHVGPATNGAVPLDEMEAFRVPRGTMAVLRPGVWHHAAFASGAKPANVLIVLPERTYANDCTVVELDEKDRIEIEET